MKMTNHTKRPIIANTVKGIVNIVANLNKANNHNLSIRRSAKSRYIVK